MSFLRGLFGSDKADSSAEVADASASTLRRAFATGQSVTLLWGPGVAASSLKARIVRHDRMIELAPVWRDARLAALKTGEAIRIVASIGERHHEALTVIETPVRKDGHILLRPPTSYKIKRGAQRVEIELAMTYSHELDAKSAARFGMPRRGTIVNLSVSGARIAVGEALTVGETIEIMFSLPDGQPLGLLARVRREAEVTDLGVHHYGVEFSELSAADERQLSLWILQAGRGFLTD